MLEHHVVQGSGLGLRYIICILAAVLSPGPWDTVSLDLHSRGKKFLPIQWDEGFHSGRNVLLLALALPY